ncbi:MAG: hypothetical protein K0U72_06300 [Gammaproteobacteria bacterium]|nr:hypothetical protein [Gammaproteobacteria bacterium]
MITARTISQFALACLLAITLPVDASDVTSLANNPFARPPSKRTVEIPTLSMSQDGSAAMLDLRATMVGTRDRLANVSGRVLRAGDEIQGFTLLKVYEDRAVFARQGKRQTVYVKPDPAESDE